MLVFNVLERPGGDPLVGLEVTVQLVANLETLRGPGFDVADKRSVVWTSETVTDETGRYEFDLEPNVNLEPSGSVYMISEKDPDRDRYEVHYVEVPNVAPPAGGYWIRDLLVDLPSALPTSITAALKTRIEALEQAVFP